MYEIWTNGRIPYEKWTNAQVYLEVVQKGYRLPCPLGRIRRGVACILCKKKNLYSSAVFLLQAARSTCTS